MSEEALFLGLTPDWVIRAVEQAGWKPTGHCSGLVCLGNRVYDLRLEDDSHIVTKFYRPGRWSRAAVLEEHELLFDLEEAEISVCAPCLFSDGRSVGEVEGIQYAVWPRTGGRSPDELSDKDVRMLGRLVARIHNVASTKEYEARGILDGESYGLDALDFLEDGGFLPPQFQPRYRKAVERLVDLYDTLSERVPIHRIHADCHYGNLLRGTDGWFFLDFDDSLLGPAVQDVWMLVPGRDEEAARQRDIFVEAYQQFRDFDPSWLSLVEPLRALRFIRYAAWIARRWKDPAFPRSYPHFNTEDYWERETRDLEEQLELCETESVRFSWGNE